MTVYLFSKLFKIHDTLLGLLATASNVISSVMYALAPNKYWFYAGTAVDMFGNSGGPVIRSLATKLVDPDKVGEYQKKFFGSLFLFSVGRLDVKMSDGSSVG